MLFRAGAVIWETGKAAKKFTKYSKQNSKNFITNKTGVKIKFPQKDANQSKNPPPIKTALKGTNSKLEITALNEIL